MTRLVLVAGFVALALFETVNALTASRRVAPDADWRAAAAEVRRGFHENDLIVFAPDWADQTGRYYLGDLVTPAMAGRADADRYANVWEVSIRGARAAETKDAQLLHSNQYGGVRVAYYQKEKPVTVAYDFTAHLDDARVSQVPADGRGDETPCFRDHDGHRCRGTHVERRTLEVEYAPRRGVLAPVDGALVTRIEYPGVPLGAQLIGYTALHDYYSRKSADGPVDFAVFVDGRQVLAVRHGNRDGWRRFTVDTAALAGAAHDVRFEVRAPSAAWRTFGFHAEARK